MGNGYLGKISAIVSANTGDYVRKLDDSARRTTAFAKTIQSDLNRASSDARKSIDAILTPLQRFERAIQNAAGTKLKFQGIEVGVQNVRELAVLVSKLERQRDIDFAVKASGLKNITELKTALNAISQDAHDVVVRVGVEGLRETRAKLDTVKEVNGKQVTVTLDARKAAEYDRAIAAYDKLGGKKKVESLVQIIGADQLDQAVAKEKRLVSVSEELAKPLGAARAKFEQLSSGIQVAFGPAMQRAQQGVIGLSEAVESWQSISSESYASVRRDVERTIATINRLVEVQNLANAGRSGKELTFQAPRVQDELVKSAQVSDRAAGMSAEFRGDEQTIRQIEVLANLRQKIAAQQASIERRQMLNLDTTEAKARLDQLLQRSETLRTSLEGRIQIVVDAEAARQNVERLRTAIREIKQGLAFSITGDVQNLSQAQQEIGKLRSEFDRLSKSQKEALARPMMRLETLVATGDEANLEKIRDTLREIESEYERIATAKKQAEIGSGSLNIITPAEAAGDTLQAKTQELARKIGNGFLGILDPAEAATDTLEAKTQELARRIGNGFLTILTPTEAAADTLQAKTQELARKIGNGFLTIVDPAEAQADTLQAKTQELARKIGNGFLSIIDPAAAAADTLGAKTQELARRIGDGFLTILDPAEAAADTLEAKTQVLARKIGDGFLNVITPAEAAADTLEAQQQELGRRIGNGFLGILTPAEAAADTLESQQQALGRRIGNGFLNILSAAEAASDTPEGRIRDRRQNLANSVGRGFGGSGVAGIEAGLNERALAGYTAQLQILQQTLSGAAATARGPAVVAFNRLRNAIGQAMQAGTLETQEVQDEIRRLTQEAVTAAAQVRNINPAALGRRVSRAGDIGRAGIDNLSLALNQAAFAIDDFFSSTGGLEFKLRAVSNNITQMAFVLGGTRGLFIGLGAVIGGQVAVAISKYAFNTEDAERKTKLLNDALSQQKSLVEELKSAYNGLSRAIGDVGESEQQRSTRDRNERFEQLRDKRKELERNRIGLSSPQVMEIRLERQQLEKDLEKPQGTFESDDAFRRRRLATQRRIQALNVEEDRVLKNTKAVSSDEAMRALSGQGREASFAGVTAALGPMGQSAQTIINEMNRVAAGAQRGDGIDAARSRQDAVRKQLEVLEQAREDVQTAGVPSERGQATAEIDKEIGRLQAILNRFTNVSDADFTAAEKISRELFRVGDEIAKGRSLIAQAFGDNAGSSALNAELNRINDVIEMLDKSANDAAAKGESPIPFEEDAAAAKKMAEELVAAAVAINRFAEVLDRIAQSVAADVSTFEQRAEAARRQDVLKSTPETAARRAIAESDAEEARRSQRSFEDLRDTARERAEQNIMQGNNPIGQRLREIDAQLAVAANEISESGIAGGTVAERESLREERRRLQEQVDAATNNDPAVVEARRRRDELTYKAESAQSADRGRELAMTPAQKAAREATQSMDDIREYFTQAVENSTGLPEDIEKIRKEQEAALQRAGEQQMRQAAPAIFQLEDEFQNALLQGPSRAELKATDVSTMEGSRELNRLLRGDDPAKDVNLVELRRQNETLQAILKELKDGGVVVDL